MNPRIWILPLLSANNSLLRGRMNGQRTEQLLVLRMGLSLKPDKPQVDQWHEDVERKQEYYHIIIFPGRT